MMGGTATAMTPSPTIAHVRRRLQYSASPELRIRRLPFQRNLSNAACMQKRPRRKPRRFTNGGVGPHFKTGGKLVSP